MAKKNNIINIYNSYNYDIKNFKILAKNILKIISIKLNEKQKLHIAVIFNDKKNSIKLNKIYRKRKYIPDVLSFGNNINNFPNINLNFKDIGDIYICYSKAINQAKKYKHSLIKELLLLFIHGLLHNLGYNHQNNAEEKIMIDLQEEIIDILNINNT